MEGPLVVGSKPRLCRAEVMRQFPLYLSKLFSRSTHPYLKPKIASARDFVN